jgi:hypothetical protein
MLLQGGQILRPLHLTTVQFQRTLHLLAGGLNFSLLIKHRPQEMVSGSVRRTGLQKGAEGGFRL